MGLFKNVIEPASIALAFTAGTLINRRRLKPQRYQRDLESIPDYISAEKKTDDASSASHRKGSNSSNKGGSNSLVFRVLSWIYGTFPFLSEIWYWLLTYWVYQLSRAFTARAIAPYPQIYLVAKQHALQLLAIEEFLHIDFEQAFQEYILTKHAYIMPLLRHIYHSHIIIGVVFIVYIYTYLPPPLFRRIRRTIAMDNFIAFIIISLWRCYPPRMLPPEYGFIDILHEGKTGSVWTHNRFRLTIAAMPSLHFGTSVLFAMSTSQVYSHRDYTIGWICALRKEQTAATAMLDVIHDDLPNHPNDPNAYTLGYIGKHNIAIAYLPEGRYGNNAAATAAAHMVSAFPSLKFGLMVGIGGGIPSNKIRLGDVVVSKPDSCFPGVVQWDLGKIEQGGTVEHTGSLNNPPTTLLTSLAKLGTKREMEGSQIPNLLAAMGEKWPNLVAKYTRSEPLRDVLFADDYTHARGPATDDSVKGTQTCDTETEEGEDEDEDVNDCRFCDFTQARKRKPRATRIHYGLIASGDMVIKDAQFRNQLNERFGNNILCVEMEAAGLMNDFPCLVIRGICDYADSHKNKAWQEYAAAVAAAFAKELLLVVPAHAVEQMDTITSILSDIRYDVGLAVDYLKEAKAFKHDEKDEKILGWISPFDYGAEHSDVLKRWQPGTCQWLLETTEFREFVERNDKRILFCPGIPGAGKTVMAATVIDYLHKQFAHDSSISIAYIYFNFRRHSEQDPNAVFSSLLKQVSQQQPSLNSSITSLYETHVKKRTCPSLKEIIKTLQDVIQMHSRVFVIIDALDECASSDHYREIILSEIIDCTKKSDLKLFATARDIPEISERFKYALRLEIKAVESDIRRYIDSRLSSLSPTSVISKSKTLQEEIKTGISDTVGGMFLLAQLHFDQLTDCITRKAVMKTLKALPTGSNAYDYTYNAAMDRINHQSSSRRQLAIKVLSWITHAVRPLSVAELQHALGVEIGEDEFDENNLPQTEDIVSTSVGLVTIDEESEVIRLVHYTTQDFFERNREKWLPNAKTYIAEVCSCYLSYSVFEDGLHEDNFKMIENFELFNYAVRFWQHHVSMSDFSQRHVNFLKKTSHLRIFEEISYSRLFTGLHIAAESGWSDIVKVLLEDIADADAHDEFNRTPFYLAASGGHDTVMRTLLNSCQIDVNVISSKSTYTPLINAAQSGHAAAVKLLLDTGKVNAGYTCKKQKSALWYAAVGGHVDVALLLSDPRNYDPGMVREIFSSALLGAVITKQEPIVHLLLETGYADVNVQTTNESSPFFWGDIPDDRPLDDAIWNDQPINMGGKINDLDDIIWSYLPIHMRRRLEDFSGIFWHYEPIKKRGKLDAFDDITWGT
ncbi:hypothetical protein A0O28_0093040 [Trichoderma guizhouense]|uniref:Uncharacterized protein n=1 Tax=Trichoderma guizhouense TaxID=1491466 RepID=A0A1T3CXE4_9HYPO|nr:hypothetical protein A0O28_0093040 [Trichoderma guizhouense]